jgi:predicted permease
MILNYIKIALRNLARQKGYSFINITGLAVGLAVCILILLWVQSEISYDRFHDHYDSIYRVMSYGTKYMTEGYEGTPEPLGAAVADGVPGIVHAVSFMGTPRMVVKYGDNSYYEKRALLTDPSFFDVFTFPLLKGNPETALSDPFSVVVTEAMAAKYFGAEDPIGEVLDFDGIEARITAVMQNVPRNSHLQFDFLIPYSIQEELGAQLHWGAFNAVTYLQIQPGSDLTEIGRKITTVAADNNCGQVADGVAFRLQPLSEIHLDARHGGYRNWVDMGEKTYVYLFSVIAVFMLFLACVNYINLSTARYEKRAREVGMRKVLGASRGQVIRQFLSESIVLSTISLGLAVVLAELFLPVFNTLVQKQLNIVYLHNLPFLGGLIGIIMITGVLSGAYPALFLSSFRPVNTLKKGPAVAARGGLPLLRRGLVLFQFVLSVLLIISTGMLFKQLHFIKNKNLGFNKENVVYIPLKEGIAEKYGVVKQELLNHPHILTVSNCDYVWALNNNRTTGFNWEGKDPQMEVDMLIPRVGFDYIETLQLEMVEGRSFSEEYETDAASAFIVSEAAVRTMQIEGPVGKHFELYGWRGLIQEGPIIGVFKDINYKSLHQKIEPQVLRILKDPATATSLGAVLLRITGDDVPATIAFLEDTWNQFNPGIPFEYHFLDDTYENLYMSEARMGNIFNYFTVLALFISCLGLFGLSSFMTEQRTKEIGIRKVHGASVASILTLINREVMILMLIAGIIATPIAWYVSRWWLQNFAYKTGLDWWVFLFGGLLALLVALLTVSYQSVKAALANPVDSLRYE